MDHEQLLDKIRDAFDGRFDRIDTKLDSQEEKLDNHLERIAKVETTVKHHQGFIRTIVATVIAIVGSIVTYFTNKLV